MECCSQVQDTLNLIFTWAWPFFPASWPGPEPPMVSCQTAVQREKNLWRLGVPPTLQTTEDLATHPICSHLRVQTYRAWTSKCLSRCLTRSSVCGWYKQGQIDLMPNKPYNSHSVHDIHEVPWSVRISFGIPTPADDLKQCLCHTPCRESMQGHSCGCLRSPRGLRQNDNHLHTVSKWIFGTSNWVISFPVWVYKIADMPARHQGTPNDHQILSLGPEWKVFHGV